MSKTKSILNKKLGIKYESIMLRMEKEIQDLNSKAYKLSEKLEKYECGNTDDFTDSDGVYNSCKRPKYHKGGHDETGRTPKNESWLSKERSN